MKKLRRDLKEKEMKLFVGNLPFSSSEDDLRDVFEAHGEVTDVFIPKDRESGRPRGFAFVTFANSEDGQKAIDATDGEELDGRNMRVSEAEERRDSGPRGGGGGNRGGNRGGGGDRGGYGGGGGGGRGRY